MGLTIDQALQKGIEAHNAGKAQEADQYYTAILKDNPKHSDANHNMGVLAVEVGKLTEALPFLRTALEINPSKAQFWFSYIEALIKLDRIEDAKDVLAQARRMGASGEGFEQIEKRIDPITSRNLNVQEPSREELGSLLNLYKKNKFHEVFNKAQKLTKRYTKSFTLWNLLGVSLAQIGQLNEAIVAFQKALSIRPDYGEGYNNLGNVLKNIGELDKAIEAYKKALSFKPDYANAYNNMGVALTEQGNLEEAIEAYKKAISIKPNYANAHRNISSIKKYSVGDKHFLQVQEILKRENLSDEDRYNLSFALAKMYDDIGKLDQAFSYLSMANSLRKKFLNYTINIDKDLFTKLKKNQPRLLKSSLKAKQLSNELSPIFILGMPRSGTTLVEQIISAHSEVTGAGELNHVSQFGTNLALNTEDKTTASVSEFRKKYLLELSKISNGKQFVTDKMPQNFLFIPLICAAFPEAKIIHVQRNAAATCWSNYKQYFTRTGLGYCYDLSDVVEYYGLYNDLMKSWQLKCGVRIYNLNYENLVTEQETETRKLIKHLKLYWEETCLLPHKNRRSVGTASHQQVRQKVYKGSSEAWHKYEPYLNGAFDSLT